ARQPTPTAHRGPTRTRLRDSRSSRRAPRRTSAGSTSCGPCARSIRACPVAFTCTWAKAGRCARCTPRCSASSTAREHPMGHPATTDTATEQVARVETLLAQLEALPEAAARDTATEAMQALLELYGEGLGRIVDELVAHLLLLHGLHPVPVEERVLEALEGVRPYMESHGGSAELLGVEDGVAHLRLEGSCSGCPSSSITLKLAIEKAIFEVAPDVHEVLAEGAVEPPVPSSGLLQLEMIRPGCAPVQARQRSA